MSKENPLFTTIDGEEEEMTAFNLYYAEEEDVARLVTDCTPETRKEFISQADMDSTSELLLSTEHSQVQKLIRKADGDDVVKLLEYDAWGMLNEIVIEADRDDVKMMIMETDRKVLRDLISSPGIDQRMLYKVLGTRPDKISDYGLAGKLYEATEEQLNAILEKAHPSTLQEILASDTIEVAEIIADLDEEHLLRLQELNSNNDVMRTILTNSKDEVILEVLSNSNTDIVAAMVNSSDSKIINKLLDEAAGRQYGETPEEPFVGPPEEEPFVGPPAPPEEEPFVGPPEEEPFVGPPEEEPFVGPPEEEPFVGPPAPPEEEPFVGPPAPPEEEPFVGPPEEEPFVGPPEEEPFVGPPEEEPFVGPPAPPEEEPAAPPAPPAPPAPSGPQEEQFKYKRGAISEFSFKDKAFFRIEDHQDAVEMGDPAIPVKVLASIWQFIITSITEQFSEGESRHLVLADTYLSFSTGAMSTQITIDGYLDASREHDDRMNFLHLYDNYMRGTKTREFMKVKFYIKNTSFRLNLESLTIGHTDLDGWVKATLTGSASLYAPGLTK